jgi:hypothetical protein
MSKYPLFLVIVAALIVLASLFYFNSLSKPPTTTTTQTTVISQYIRYVDSCVIDNESAYLICCQKDGRTYDCSNQESFKANEFITLKVNLLKLYENKSIPYNPLYVCTYSQIIPLEEELPSHYSSHTMIVENSAGELVECSTKLHLNEKHIVTDAGFIPDSSTVKITEIRVFPDHDYKTLDDFKAYYSSSIQIFNLTRSVSK